MGSNLPGLLLGAALLADIRLFFAKRGLLASVRSSIAAAMAGSVIYPLLLCTFMGVAGARMFNDNHGWSRFKFAFSTYAQAAPTDSIPRGAVMGLFVMVCGDIFRRKTTIQ